MENVLTYMTFVPVAGAAIVLALPNNAKLIRWVSAAATVPPLLMAIWLFKNFDRAKAGFQFIEDYTWIPSYNISYTMGDMGFGFLGNTGTVGGTVPTATGAALAAKVRGSSEVVISFFGDGAANQGVVHEAMNLAGVWKLPVIYVCENNQYAMTVSLEKSVAIKHLSDRAAAYGFEGKTIDGNDVETVYDAAQAAAAKARRGDGATFLECITYRWDGHFGGDPGTGYRSKEEIESWKQKCPIKRLSEKLIQEGLLTAQEFQKMNDVVYAELDEVAKRAEAAPLPKKEVDLTSIYASAEVADG